MPVVVVAGKSGGGCSCSASIVQNVTDGQVGRRRNYLARFRRRRFSLAFHSPVRLVDHFFYQATTRMIDLVNTILVVGGGAMFAFLMAWSPGSGKKGFALALVAWAFFVLFGLHFVNGVLSLPRLGQYIVVFTYVGAVALYVGRESSANLHSVQDGRGERPTTAPGKGETT